MDNFNNWGIEELVKYLIENKLEITVEDGKITNVSNAESV